MPFLSCRTTHRQAGLIRISSLATKYSSIVFTLYPGGEGQGEGAFSNENDYQGLVDVAWIGTQFIGLPPPSFVYLPTGSMPFWLKYPARVA